MSIKKANITGFYDQQQGQNIKTSECQSFIHVPVR